MFEVLLTGGIVAAFGTIWYKSHKKNKIFFHKMTKMEAALDDFMRLNDIEYIDFELYNAEDLPKLKKKYLESSVVEWIAKEIDKGYDLYRMRLPAGYNSINHRHNFSDEFFYVLTGSITVSYGDAKEVLSQEEYLFIEQEMFHYIEASEDSDILVIAKPSLFRRI